jgi:hypothetical protein
VRLVTTEGTEDHPIQEFEVKARVVETGTDASRAKGRTSKACLTLKPRDATIGGEGLIVRT